jgi:hypothetical protein
MIWPVEYQHGRLVSQSTNLRLETYAMPDRGPHEGCIIATWRIHIVNDNIRTIELYTLAFQTVHVYKYVHGVLQTRRDVVANFIGRQMPRTLKLTKAKVSLRQPFN